MSLNSNVCISYINKKRAKNREELKMKSFVIWSRLRHLNWRHLLVLKLANKNFKDRIWSLDLQNLQRTLNFTWTINKLSLLLRVSHDLEARIASKSRIGQEITRLLKFEKKVKWCCLNSYCFRNHFRYNRFQHTWEFLNSLNHLY